MPEKINENEPLDMHERYPHVCSQRCPCGHWPTTRPYAGWAGKRSTSNLDIIEHTNDIDTTYEDLAFDCE